MIKRGNGLWLTVFVHDQESDLTTWKINRLFSSL